MRKSHLIVLICASFAFATLGTSAGAEARSAATQDWAVEQALRVADALERNSTKMPVSTQYGNVRIVGLYEEAIVPLVFYSGYMLAESGRTKDALKFYELLVDMQKRVRKHPSTKKTSDPWVAAKNFECTVFGAAQALGYKAGKFDAHDVQENLNDFFGDKKFRNYLIFAQHCLSDYVSVYLAEADRKGELKEIVRQVMGQVTAGYLGIASTGTLDGRVDSNFLKSAAIWLSAQEAMNWFERLSYTSEASTLALTVRDLQDVTEWIALLDYERTGGANNRLIISGALNAIGTLSMNKHDYSVAEFGQNAGADKLRETIDILYLSLLGGNIDFYSKSAEKWVQAAVRIGGMSLADACFNVPLPVSIEIQDLLNETDRRSTRRQLGVALPRDVVSCASAADTGVATTFKDSFKYIEVPSLAGLKWPSWIRSRRRELAAELSSGRAPCIFFLRKSQPDDCDETDPVTKALAPKAYEAQSNALKYVESFFKADDPQWVSLAQTVVDFELAEANPSLPKNSSEEASNEEENEVAMTALWFVFESLGYEKALPWGMRSTLFLK